jgi:RNA polymerase sigma factor (sigma-70 family)
MSTCNIKDPISDSKATPNSILGVENEVPYTIGENDKLERGSVEGNFYAYLADIAKCKVLSNTEEYELICRAKGGDERARTQVLHSCLFFVISVAKKYRNSGVDFLDLIQAGNEGLVRAFDKYQPTEGGACLVLYAVFEIRKQINRAIRQGSRVIHLPEKITEKAKKYLKRMDECEREGLRVSPFELDAHFEAVKETEECIEDTEAQGKRDVSSRLTGDELRRVMQITCSLGTPYVHNLNSSEGYDSKGIEGTIGDSVADEQFLNLDEWAHRDSLRGIANKLLWLLTSENRQIVYEYLECECAFDEVALINQTEHDTVRWRKDNAMKRLKSLGKKMGYLGEDLFDE